MKAEILREVKDQTWVANPVMVKKSDRGWRLCVEFTNINKACPKDRYPFPDFYWKVESLSGFHLKCFLDAYKDYHQIQMVEGDEDKTAFFTGKGIFCYRKMPFGMKNAGATYQILVDKNAQGDIGLNGKLAALSRFLSKGADKSLPLFKALKNCTDKKTIQWTVDAEEAFRKIKEFVEILPTLTAPVKGEVLILADFLVKTPSVEMEIKKPKATNKAPKSENTWKLYTDETSSSDGSGAGLMLVIPEGKEYTYALRFEFETTNNEAEYEALLAGLGIAEEMEIKNLAIFIDSRLVANQVKGLLEARHPIIKQYLEKTKNQGSVGRSVGKQIDKQQGGSLGNQHRGTSTNGSEKYEVLSYSCQTFHQVDRSKTFNHSKWKTDRKVHMGAHGRFGFPQTITTKDKKQFTKGIFTDFFKGLKIRQSFSPITEHAEIMNYIEKQQARSQQGWVDDLPQILWVNRILPRNIQKETPFTLTYGSEAIIPKVTNPTFGKEESVIHEKAERKGDEEREVTLIEEAYYRNKLQRYHDTRNGRSTFSLGDFELLSSHNEDDHKQVRKGPHIISGAYEGGLYNITNAFDYSLIHTVKGSSLHKFYM
ncbi:reverse transcriptase domain-containing protein [Tanacetum coccineum]|uniref:Reverse transcriptase domain-containing protein n=1 Tax=Tanacetum coccineum TaxID=301880 RepID=A0ABQ5HLR3_9ASTR